MTSQHIQKTLEEFDEQFGAPGPDKNTDSIGRGAGCDDCCTNIALRDEHKSFLSQALTEQHEADVQSFREKVEGMRKEIANSWTIRAAFTSNYESIGYNQALDDLLASLDDTEK